MSENQKGELWVSVFDEGIVVIDATKKEIIHKYLYSEQTIHGLDQNYIDYIFFDTRGTIWLTSKVRSADIDIGLSYQEKNSKSFNTLIENILLLQLLEDAEGRIWFSGPSGLGYIVPDSNYYIHYYSDPKLRKWVSNIFQIDGNIYVTADGIGLINITDSLKVIDESDGFLFNTVSFINSPSPTAVDFNDNIWLPTVRGLSVFNHYNQSIYNLTVNDGIIEILDWCAVNQRKNGEILFASKGVNIINPQIVKSTKGSPVKLYFSTLFINGKEIKTRDPEILSKDVSFEQSIDLKYWQKDIGIDLVAIEFDSNEELEFTWKLENYDQEWSAPSKNRQIRYTNLTPGSYDLLAKVRHAHGQWSSNAIKLVININPPWWKTWWAYIFYALIASSIFYWFLERFKREQLRKERERQKDQELAQAKVLEEAYNDLDLAHNNLKSTQSQLIQSEKMASLGELTAGIAHEIQNPLNFVNNFSEVSSELVDELDEELDRGNINVLKEISHDLQNNLKKITEHGQRASSIVKGMLDHSRTSSSEKVPTDMNKLCDEYFRLAYHGTRAKQKNFNVDMKTDFDASLGNVNIVPQDMGRVILNLINNAFYAVSEKARMVSDPAYKPAVALSTKNLGDKIEIIVKDNGNGIPGSIKEKIFQPFFTTKPAGQGTGLGLSLSYDIVNAHGGIFKVQSQEGEGTLFTISLPLA